MVSSVARTNRNTFLTICTLLWNKEARYTNRSQMIAQRWYAMSTWAQCRIIIIQFSKSKIPSLILHFKLLLIQHSLLRADKTHPWWISNESSISQCLYFVMSLNDIKFFYFTMMMLNLNSSIAISCD